MYDRWFSGAVRGNLGNLEFIIIVSMYICGRQYGMELLEAYDTYLDQGSVIRIPSDL